MSENGPPDAAVLVSPSGDEGFDEETENAIMETLYEIGEIILVRSGQ